MWRRSGSQRRGLVQFTSASAMQFRESEERYPTASGNVTKEIYAAVFVILEEASMAIFQSKASRPRQGCPSTKARFSARWAALSRMLSRTSTSSHQKGDASVGDRAVRETGCKKKVAAWSHRRSSSDGYRMQERYICLNQCS